VFAAYFTVLVAMTPVQTWLLHDCSPACAEPTSNE
jgi:hypothetical protein